jgi:hypothetical protein
MTCAFAFVRVNSRFKTLTQFQPLLIFRGSSDGAIHEGMKHDPLDQSRQNAEALALFRKALDQNAPIGGLERVRLATQRELARVRKFCLPHAKWLLPATAAILVLSGAGFLVRSLVPICPHGSSNRELNWRRVPASVQHEFLGNPDRFRRVCHCTPRYSGNLRVP